MKAVKRAISQGMYMYYLVYWSYYKTYKEVQLYFILTILHTILYNIYAYSESLSCNVFFSVFEQRNNRIMNILKNVHLNILEKTDGA